jgi:hypothetical protein
MVAVLFVKPNAQPAGNPAIHPHWPDMWSVLYKASPEPDGKYRVVAIVGQRMAD